MLVAALVILAGVVVVASGRGGEMAFEYPDYPPLDLGPVTAADVALLRPPSAAWGYNMRVTDEALTLIAKAMSERDVRISSLQRQVDDLRAELSRGSTPWPGARHAVRDRGPGTGEELSTPVWPPAAEPAWPADDTAAGDSVPWQPPPEAAPGAAAFEDGAGEHEAREHTAVEGKEHQDTGQDTGRDDAEPGDGGATGVAGPAAGQGAPAGLGPGERAQDGAAGAVPGAATPGEAAPDHGVPGHGAPGVSALDDGAPGHGEPDDTVVDGSIPVVTAEAPGEDGLDHGPPDDTVVDGSIPVVTAAGPPGQTGYEVEPEPPGQRSAERDLADLHEVRRAERGDG
jgi:hypothetical protein